jgi:putative tryptophan/tyrosine transport system substrate-binding protein
MERWSNPDRSITPLFQHYNSQIESVSNSLRLALCTLFVEQPTKFELVINLKTAKQIDIMIPSSVLTKTDSVIK